MTKIIITVLQCLLLMLFMSDSYAGSRKPKDDEVAIHFSGVEVPMERFLLIRNKDQYLSVKFTKHWTDVDKKRKEEADTYVRSGRLTEDGAEYLYVEKYAAYEAYYQNDGSGDFTKSNAIKCSDIASKLPLRGPFRPFIYQPGNSYIECGPIRLAWEYKGFVGFMPPSKENGDFGFELAPTTWADVSQVNVYDRRVKWYKYDEKRNRVFIQIDNLWDYD